LEWAGFGRHPWILLAVEPTPHHTKTTVDFSVLRVTLDKICLFLIWKSVAGSGQKSVLI
jgi:hypothetical protein